MHTEVHQSFLQACANHGSLKLQEAITILNSIQEKYDKRPQATEEELRKTVEVINNAITEFNQQLKFVKHELLGAEFLIFSSIAESDINKIQSKYTQADCKYFGLLLKEIALDESLSINPINALNLSSACSSKPFTKKHAEDLIQDFCSSGYLVEINDMLTFGPRAVVEFMPFIKRNYPDCVQDCSLCLKSLFWGVSCDACSKLFHRECIYKYLIKMSSCPSCKEQWTKRLD